MRVTELLDRVVDRLDELPRSSPSDPDPEVLIEWNGAVAEPLAVEVRLDRVGRVTYVCLVVATAGLTVDDLVDLDAH